MAFAIDRKFKITATNTSTGKQYTDNEAILLCAKDLAVIPALQAYKKACEELGSNQEHIKSVELLIGRVGKFQNEIESKVPDTLGQEINKCILEGEV